jgi:hypothetical protein
MLDWIHRQRMGQKALRLRLFLGPQTGGTSYVEVADFKNVFLFSHQFQKTNIFVLLLSMLTLCLHCPNTSIWRGA